MEKADIRRPSDCWSRVSPVWIETRSNQPKRRVEDEIYSSAVRNMRQDQTISPTGPGDQGQMHGEGY